MPQTPLPLRSVIALSGEDRVGFLQGLVSNDVALAAPGRAVWAALLTPQGKWLADFFVFADAGRLLLDAEAAQAESLVHRLSRFRLRAKVALAPAPELSVAAGWGGAPMPPGLGAPDPRHPGAGWRALLAAPPPADATAEDYDRHRLALGLPDGARDLEADKSVLLEAGFDELDGISWSKGCYMGQELTARTKYRGLLKRRLFPVAVDGPLPARGTPVLREDGAEMGEMRSGRDGLGLALLRMPVAEGQALRCGDATLLARVPDWMARPPG
ncbi:YgfZ/GcvT domain-containing protein [Roseomonas haemaphysalidis]|uniref:Folate-binding protein YgfZ n=1 Tax=Roseomonas haemaphysalidis TaxID=2768162 RepID=A0ABS3KJ40_9PROT|nr:folate-binding protein YgfZ [Roseomonas haemaphysalidis]MBO1077479.1 folate-binding protein YgfZ [Roseomonas haemaphysalidis]